MEQHWKDILPVDRYIVRSAALLHDYDRKILTLLYQPLIGAQAFSLYLTLWSELEQNRLWSEENTHHSIMTLQQTNLKTIYRERLKLEGIGLLKTFVKHDHEDRIFIYELQSPLTPRDFFNDGMLNVYLYNRLGKSKFLKVKKFFSDHELDTSVYKPITKSFNEVFTSFQPSEMVTNKEVEQDLERNNGEEFLTGTTNYQLEVSDDTFDFDLFFAGLSEVMIPMKSITPKVKDAITKLSFLYNINPIDMQNIAMGAIIDDESIDIERLRKAARDWYQFEHGNELPTLTERVQPIPFRTMTEQEPKTKDEELMKQLEIISPRQLLVEMSGGVEPSAVDLKIIEDVMFHQKLLPGVVNVLIYYVMLKTDMKLSKGYIEKIASHWTRKGVKTVKEAMALAKDENREYQNWAKGKKQAKKPRPTYKKEAAKVESLPVKQVEEDEDEFSFEKKELQARVAKMKELLNSNDD